jgi:hypothetical protein
VQPEILTWRKQLAEVLKVLRCRIKEKQKGALDTLTSLVTAWQTLNSLFSLTWAYVQLRELNSCVYPVSSLACNQCETKQCVTLLPILGFINI